MRTCYGGARLHAEWLQRFVIHMTGLDNYVDPTALSVVCVNIPRLKFIKPGPIEVRMKKLK